MARAHRYTAVADAIRSRIVAGELGAGDLLDGEAELAATYDVSRMTVRKALALLKAEGLLDSRQGFGWFVAPRPVPQRLAQLSTIEAQIAAAGLTPARRVLEFRFVPAPPDVARILDSPDVLEVTRVNLADDRAIARVTVWVPSRLAENLSRSQVERAPLYELIGVPLGSALQTVTAVAATGDDARLLGVPEGSPMLHTHRVTYDWTGKPVLVSETVLNPLMTELVVELPAAATAEPSGLRLVQS